MECRLTTLSNEELESVDGGSITAGTAVVVCVCVVLIGSAVTNFFNGLTDGLTE